jgi:hypothetical protein
LVHVKHYKFNLSSDIGKMVEKKQAVHHVVKRAAAAKTEEELAYEEYQRQLELAIENH